MSRRDLRFRVTIILVVAGLMLTGCATANESQQHYDAGLELQV